MPDGFLVLFNDIRFSFTGTKDYGCGDDDKFQGRYDSTFKAEGEIIEYAVRSRLQMEEGPFGYKA